MAFISLDEAATRLGVPRETIEDWVQRGLLAVHAPPHPGASAFPPGVPCVEEEQLFDVAESLGWLELSTEHWDGDEDA